MLSAPSFPYELGIVLLDVYAVLAVRGRHVVLLDTTTETSLEWTRYPYGPQARTPGWVEESFTDFEKGINWRSYVVCDVAYRDVNNWLWTPLIERSNASRIYIELQFSMRDCSLFPGMAVSCKETFSLLYYEIDEGSRETPPWEPESYKLIDRIAADEGRFTSTSEVIINTEVRSIPVTKRGVYFAVRDEGACLSLIALRVYYITCPNVTLNHAFFPETPTAADITAIVAQEGRCVSNAQMVETPRLVCKGDGEWTLPTGGCKCRPGHEPAGHECRACPHGMFKSTVGDAPCQPCPRNSEALIEGSPECQCIEGFFRSPSDPKSMACTQPPRAPQNLTFAFVDQSTVILVWNQPRDDGGRRDTTYRVRCDACGAQATYTPAQSGFNETRVTVSGLSPVTRYRFEVFAENGVTPVAGEELRKAEILVRTEPSVAFVIKKVFARPVRINEIMLNWDPPKSASSSTDTTIERYEIRYFPRKFSKNETIVQTNMTQISIGNLMANTEYGFQVRVRTQRGFGEYSEALYRTTGIQQGSPLAGIGGMSGSASVGGSGHSGLRQSEGATDSSTSGQVTVIVGLSVVVVIVIIALVVAFLYVKRNNEECNKKQPSDCDTLEYRNGEGKKMVDQGPLVQTTPLFTTPLFTNCGTIGSRSYVDPHTYEDPQQAMREFTREIDREAISIEDVIGAGEFADVCRGLLRQTTQRGEVRLVPVAVKTLKQGSTEKARNDFLTEATIMGQFDHPNVIYLEGVVTRTSPVMIITELMENGSLDQYLRDNKGQFNMIELVAMLHGIASGMQYLSSMNFVHRDLAARNVLVNAELVCKIADFGLSREIEYSAYSGSKGEYRTSGGKIPVRWTAPEGIQFRIFTTASDVWSFGIVCWEVLSLGERPYYNWPNQDVIKKVEDGYRLPPPRDCPEALHMLMVDCWRSDRTLRPSFTSIVGTLEGLLKQPGTLRRLAVNNNKQQHQLLQGGGACHQRSQHSSTLQLNNVGVAGSGLSGMVSLGTQPHSSMQHLQQQQSAIYGCTPNSVTLGGAHSTMQLHHNAANARSVEEWLTMIKMSRYLDHFLRGGFTTLESVAHLSHSDLVRIGVQLVGHQIKLLNEAEQLRAGRQAGAHDLKSQQGHDGFLV
ncbi:ephrin type-B receptor 1-B-like isoform X2 [Varroa destructor]|uniref:receptor protein-tyrosine kinase n=1 Tax=Varroa destructor TaxID=109461 RepID=A0A7M7KTK6_VARDE|nr:ephrin type-B receptor 1-B-like isoform X2 [Varroa destructor]